MATLFQRLVCTTLILGIVQFWTSTSADFVAIEHEHDQENDHFADIGNFLLDLELANEREELDFAENPGKNITFEQVRYLVETVFWRVDCDQRVENCSMCQNDFTTDVFAALNADEKYGLDGDTFLYACPLLLYGTYELVSVCQAGAGGTDLGEEAVMLALKSSDGANVTMSEADLDVILDAIFEDYIEETNAECFDVESVFDETVHDHDAGANDSELRLASQSVMSGLLYGHCIGEATLPSTTEFTDVVFDSYASVNGIINEEEFEDILIDLGIGGSDNHDDHDHDHARRRRSVAMETKLEGRSLEKRAISLDPDAHEHHNHSHVANVTQTCFTGEELLDIYGIEHEAGVTKSKFDELSSALVQQVLSGACAVEESEPITITPAQTWGYGTLAVAFISSMAVIGGLFIPCLSEGVYEKTIQTMIALAVATLTGDAILHLLPQAVGLHTHNHAGEGTHTPTSPEMAYIWKCLVVEIMIYAFFVFEQLTSFTTCGAHSHGHAPPMEMTSNGKPRSASNLSGLKYGTAKSESTTQLANIEDGASITTESRDNQCCTGCNSVATMIILGDSLHNFGDGLAIGAAFTVSVAAGLSTSIAVLCHELPHELGDIAVLLNQGMKLWVALLLNLMCACTAFIGLWVGIPLGQTELAREWIFAAVAGMFLYVGLVNMLPMLHCYQGKSSKVSIAILQNIGFLLGIGIILVIALYEDSIAVSL